MHIEFLVEEPSIEAAFRNLLPRMLPAKTSYRILVFQGKDDLLKQLPARLRAYASWINDEYRIVVTVDEDRQDCHTIKNQLEKICAQSGLITKTRIRKPGFQVLNRIIIEELEAWFIGDINAILQAYPRVPNTFSNWKKFRDPDAVPGGTWKSLEQSLQRYGYFTGGYAKIQAAREISAHMDPLNNRSKSFQVFRDGLLALLSPLLPNPQSGRLP